MITRYAAAVNEEVDLTDEQRKALARKQKSVFRAEDTLVAKIRDRDEYMRALYNSGVTPTKIGAATPNRSGGTTGRTIIARIVRGVAYRSDRLGIKRPRVH